MILDSPANDSIKPPHELVSFSSMETLYPASYVSNSIWTREENKRFQSALAIYSESTPDRWIKVAAIIPEKTVLDVMKHYRDLEEDVGDIEAFDANRKRPLGPKSSDHERMKRVPWTADEHRLFLLGLTKYGKGDWRNISRNYVISRTPTQVASHAQKYFIRQQLSGGKDKRRPSIHDINLTDTSSSLDRPQASSANDGGGAAMVFGSNPGNLFIPSRL